MTNDTDFKLLLDCNNVQMQVHFLLNHLQKNVILSLIIFRKCVVCGSHSHFGEKNTFMYLLGINGLRN